MAVAVHNDGAHDGIAPDGIAEDGIERRCFVTGEVRPRQGLVRFVVDPCDAGACDLAHRAGREHLG